MSLTRRAQVKNYPEILILIKCVAAGISPLAILQKIQFSIFKSFFLKIQDFDLQQSVILVVLLRIFQDEISCD